MNAAIPETMLAALSLDLRLRQFLYREADLLGGESR